QEGTGNPEEFAKRLKFSRSTFFKYLAYLREDLELDIKYSLYKQSYYYAGKGLRCTLGNKECAACESRHMHIPV
ncbi:MAG: hypothetical protein LIO97_00785, partial [Tannerellaceae bacterium]|nr:hypothetical protein [Tannerellaceae bacterium]